MSGQLSDFCGEPPRYDRIVHIPLLGTYEDTNGDRHPWATGTLGRQAPLVIYAYNRDHEAVPICDRTNH